MAVYALTVFYEGTGPALFVGGGFTGLALQALLRRDEFDPPARVELLEQMAAHFRWLVEFPPEAVEGITDEQYIRNMVDILFRPRASELK